MQAMGAMAATAAGSASSQALPSRAPQVQARPYLATTRSCCAGVLRSFCSMLPQLGSLQCMLLLDYCQLLHCSARTFSFSTTRLQASRAESTRRCEFFPLRFLHRSAVNFPVAAETTQTASANGGNGGTGITANKPTSKPTYKPTNKPTDKPTYKPTNKPTNQPTYEPTQGITIGGGRPCLSACRAPWSPACAALHPYCVDLILGRRCGIRLPLADLNQGAGDTNCCMRCGAQARAVTVATAGLRISSRIPTRAAMAIQARQFVPACPCNAS